MYLLKKIIIVFLFAVFLFSSCNSLGPLSVEEAMTIVKKSYKNYDSELLLSVLSTKSKNKIRKMIYTFSNMNKKQQKEIATRLNYSEKKIGILKIQDYLYIYMKKEKRNNSTRESIMLNIIGIDYFDNVATAKMENGMKFKFMKEGPYWKFVIL